MRRTQTKSGSLIKEKYDIQYLIGTGTFGNVYLAHSREKPSQVVAIKMVKKNKDTRLKMDIVREIALLKEISHNNITDLVEVLVEPVNLKLYLIFQFAEYDLEVIVKWHNKSQRLLNEGVVKSFVWQILDGINYLHMNWIVHRDLKPANILVMGAGEHEGQIKIADFGLARIFKSPLRVLSDVDTLVVTIWYRAPELLLGSKHHTRAVDIWSIGCIFAELLLLAPFFMGREETGNNFQADQMRKIMYLVGEIDPSDWKMAGKLPFYEDYRNLFARDLPHRGAAREKLEKNVTKEGLSLLLEDMLAYNPTRRKTAEECLKHEFFKQKPCPQTNSFVFFDGDRNQMPKYPIRQKVIPKKK